MRLKRRHKSLFITRRHADAAPANLVWTIFDDVAQQIHDAADTRRHHRPRICHRFDQRQRRAFVTRRQRNYVERRIEILRIFSSANKDHVFVETERLCLQFESLRADQPSPITMKRTVALPPTRRIDRFQTRDDVQKHLVVLDLRQAADDPDEDRMVVEYRARAETSRAALRGRQRNRDRDPSGITLICPLRPTRNVSPISTLCCWLITIRRSVTIRASSLSIARNNRVRLRP